MKLNSQVFSFVEYKDILWDLNLVTSSVQFWFVSDGIESAFNNSNRHSVGISLLSKVFGSGKATSAEGFMEDRESRPFFTYWVSIVQIIIFIVVIATYGIAPYGLGVKSSTDNVRPCAMFGSYTLDVYER